MKTVREALIEAGYDADKIAVEDRERLSEVLNKTLHRVVNYNADYESKAAKRLERALLDVIQELQL